VFWPQHAISLIEEQVRRELSPGCSYDPVLEPETYRGEGYDIWMSSILFNHVALGAFSCASLARALSASGGTLATGKIPVDEFL
jgi:hypothetical protein